MRIGILCHSSCGGSARIAAESAHELARRGHRVQLFARTFPFGWRDGANEVVVRPLLANGTGRIHPAQLYVDWPADEYRASLDCLAQRCVEEKIDILHFHHALPFAFLAAELRRRLGTEAPALVGTLHGTDVTEYGRDPVQRPRLVEALRSVDALTAVSRSFAHLAAKLFGLSVGPEVIPDFVDLARFRPHIPEGRASGAASGGRSAPRARRIIVHLSNFRPVKDPESVARIFLLIRARMECELWLIGDGQGMGPLRAVLQQAGAEGDVRYWGLQPDVAAILAHADLLLMTSLSESFCLAALEAMACGVPVLSTRVGGVPEVVVHGETGYLFPVGEHALAAELAVGLLSEPARYRAMRDAALARARRFDQRKVVSGYEELYLRLLAGRAG